MVYACGQFALIGGAPDTSGFDASSSMAADYSAWRPAAFAAVNPGIILAALRDFGLNGLPVLSNGGNGCLLGASCTPPSLTPTPSSTAMPTPTLTAPTATHAATKVDPPSATPNDELPSARGSTATPAYTATPANTPVPPIPTDTDVPPASPTAVPPTAVPTACPFGGCEPDIGTPDGTYATLSPGMEMIYSLANPIVVDGSPDVDLVYYERELAPGAGVVWFDLVVIRIGQTVTGNWFVVFDWGDGQPDTNTNVGNFGVDGTEEPNAVIATGDLYGAPPYQTGVTIDVDGSGAPPGTYELLSVSAPTPAAGETRLPDENTEVDAVEILPTSAP